MKGKNKCKILKQIRKEIADQNEIAYAVTECKFQGDCSGTCPKCEAELRYLEAELSKRRKAGKAVAVAGVAAALMVGALGCTNAEQPETVTTIPSSAETAVNTTEDTTEALVAGGLEPVDEVLYTVPEDLFDERDLMGNMIDLGEQWEP